MSLGDEIPAITDRIYGDDVCVDVCFLVMTTHLKNKCPL